MSSSRSDRRTIRSRRGRHRRSRAGGSRYRRCESQLGRGGRPERRSKSIPVSGRNWASLMLLAPGAVNWRRLAAQHSTAIRSMTPTTPSMASITTACRSRRRRRRAGSISRWTPSPSSASRPRHTQRKPVRPAAAFRSSPRPGLINSMAAFYAFRTDALDACSPFDGATLPPFTCVRFEFRRSIKRTKPSSPTTKA